MGEVTIAELRQKWAAYDARLNRPDAHTGGSLAAAAYIIARSGVTDVALLLERLAAAEKVVEAARPVCEMARVSSWLTPGDIRELNRAVAGYSAAAPPTGRGADGWEGNRG